MRHLTKLLLTAGLAVAFVSLTLAQQPGRGFGGTQVSEDRLLTAKKIQEEIKLTDAQKEKLTKLSDKRREMMKDAFKDGKIDQAAMQKVNDEITKETTQFIKTELKPEQAKRVKQIYYQASVQFDGPGIFAKDEVQTELKFDAKQKELIKNTVDDTAKDAKEIRQSGDKKDFKATQEKITELNKKAVDKITASFSATQKKTWEEMQGAKFELTRQDLGGGGGGGFPGKDKKKDK